MALPLYFVGDTYSFQKCILVCRQFVYIILKRLLKLKRNIALYKEGNTYTCIYQTRGNKIGFSNYNYYIALPLIFQYC